MHHDSIPLVGVRLIHLMTMTDKAGQVLRQMWQGTDERLRVVELELYFLRVMAIDYATHSQYGPESPVRAGLLEGFYEVVTQFCQESGLEQAFELRQNEYGRAFHRCVADDPSGVAGGHFANCSGFSVRGGALATFMLLSTIGEAEFRDLCTRAMVFLNAFTFQ